MLGDNFTLTSAASSVTAAFRDADTLVQKLKVRCVARRTASTPDTLEHTINQAPNEIERAQRRIIERFGPSGQNGDHIAIIELQQVTIQLQMGLLESLRRALDEPEAADFTTIIDYADDALDGALGAMMSLRHRLTASRPLSTEATSGSHPAMAQPQHDTPPSQQSSNVPPIPQRHELRKPRQWVDPYFNSKDPPAAEASTPPQQGRSASVFSFLRRQQTKGGSQNSLSDTPVADYRAGTSEWSQDQRKPAARSIASSSDDTCATSAYSAAWSAYERQMDPSHASGYSAAVYSPVSETSQPDSVLSAPTSASPALTQHPLRVQSIAERLITPAADNDYLGFCKGAWRVQVDDPKAMTESRDFTQSAQSKTTFPSCTKCSFRGHLPYKTIWNKVFVDETRGLKYRWAFLAKSHVKQKNTLERNYGYQCLFCVFLGGKSPVFDKDLLLDHCSREHRHGLFSSVLLYRTNCINNRVCENHDKFDINLFPVKQEAARAKSGPGAVEQLAADVRAFELAG